jgi:hypothetical protein
MTQVQLKKLTSIEELWWFQENVLKPLAEIIVFSVMVEVIGSLTVRSTQERHLPVSSVLLA